MSMLSLSGASKRSEILAAAERDASETTAKLETLRTSLGEARAHAARLQASLDAQYARCRELESELREVTLAFDHRVEQREAQLRTVPDPRIERMLEELESMRAGLQHQIRRFEGTRLDANSGRRVPVSGSNLDAVHGVAEAIYQARRRVEAMSFRRCDNLDTVLQEIRRSIPTVEQLEAKLQEDAAS